MSACTLPPEPKIIKLQNSIKRRNPSREIGVEPTPKGRKGTELKKDCLCRQLDNEKKKSKKEKDPSDLNLSP